jgi:hypothetical protein
MLQALASAAIASFAAAFFRELESVMSGAVESVIVYCRRRYWDGFALDILP